MRHKLPDILIYLLASNRKRLPVRILRRIATMYLRGCQNLSYDSDLNGEDMVLRRLRESNLEVLFDVGANRGDWTLMARKHLPRSAVHCFEIAPAMHPLLDRAVKGLNPPVIINHLGLLDHSGTVKLNFCVDNDYVSSVIESPVPVKSVQVDVPVQTGDAYAESRSVSRIDFLKLDVEGAENLVLKGFSKMLGAGAIRIIQFEYGKGNIMSGFLLKDFYRLLEPFGYAIGKIYPNGVDFQDYSSFDENFVGPNFLAVLKRERDLVRNLC